jgi:hypothetical protein
VINLTTETIINFAEAAKSIPRRPPMAPSTIWRWVRNGCRADNGEIVKLEAIRLGGRFLTSREALQRFAEALAPAGTTPELLPLRTPTKRQRESERAGRRLQEAGI